MRQKLASVPAEFVDLKEVIPDIRIELAYATTENFMGRVVTGYEANRALLTWPAAQALGLVQDALRGQGKSLKVFDAYRPQRAVNAFMRWAQEKEDGKTQAKYYPRLQKQELFLEGYLLAESSHSRGSTVDLTIVECHSDGREEELDMGSCFDFFDRRSWLNAENLTSVQQSNRDLLHSLMLAHGFCSFGMEWWHFTLLNEPFPNQSFDFVIEATQSKA